MYSKHFMFDPKKLNTSPNDDKYCCLFFIYIWNNFLPPDTWEYEKHYILKAEQGLLDGVYTKVEITKIKKGFLNKRKRVKGFFIFMAVPSFKQVKSNYGKKEPCERACSWVIKFSRCLNFGYGKHGIILFFNLNSKWL